MKKGRYKNLFSNMMIFTIGNFVSKLLVFFLVPFYTNVLSTSEYGIADGMQATLLLLVPLLTINAGEAVLRFGLEKDAKSGSVFICGIKRVVYSDAVVFVVCAICAGIIKNHFWKEYFVLFFFLYICNSFYEFMLLFCQGAEQLKIMITGSIMATALVIASNIYFLLIIKIGLNGYFFSQMISFLGAGLIMLFMMKKSGCFENRLVEADEKNLDKEMHGYGKSMLLYSTSSWINNALDRYFVLFMCGAAANGLYGVAYKIPAILTVFQRIFAQAWQISATKNYKEKDGSLYFSNVYKGYQIILSIGCTGLILFVKIIAKLLFAKDFYYAWDIVPPLLISVIFGALTGFLGSICLAYKDGKSMGKATAAGAVVNIILNLILINIIGTEGAAIATAISYFVMFAAAFYYVRKHVVLDINLKKDILVYILLVAQAVSVMKELPYWYIIDTVILFVIVGIYGKDVYAEIRRKS